MAAGSQPPAYLPHNRQVRRLGLGGPDPSASLNRYGDRIEIHRCRGHRGIIRIIAAPAARDISGKLIGALIDEYAADPVDAEIAQLDHDPFHLLGGQQRIAQPPDEQVPLLVQVKFGDKAIIAAEQMQCRQGGRNLDDARRNKRLIPVARGHYPAVGAGDAIGAVADEAGKGPAVRHDGLPGRQNKDEQKNERNTDGTKRSLHFSARRKIYSTRGRRARDAAISSLGRE